MHATDPASDEDVVDTRPWRKRHPVLSRVLLFGIGGGLAALLLVLLSQRTEEDALTKLRGELQNMDIVLATHGGAERVLEILDENTAGLELPKDLAVKAGRYRAMALRNQWRRAQRPPLSAGPEPRAIEAVLEATAALDPEPLAKRALMLEWAEWRLEQEDPEGALDRLGRVRLPAGSAWWLLGEQLRLVARAIGNEPEAAADEVLPLLDSLPRPLPATGEPIRVGGTQWMPQDVALVLIEKGSALYRRLGRDPAPLFSRLPGLVEGHPLAMLRAARLLADRGDRPGARALILGARKVDPGTTGKFLESSRKLRELLID